MTVPAWVAASLAGRWPGVVAEWQLWATPQETVIPLEGIAFYRRVTTDGHVWQKAIAPGSGADWFELHGRELSPGRFVIMDNSKKPYRIVDCVTPECELVEPGQQWLRAVASRHDGWDEFFRRATAELEGEQQEEGDYLTLDEVKKRRSMREAMREPFLHAANGVYGVKPFAYNGPVALIGDGGGKREVTPLGLNVVDKRRFAEIVQHAPLSPGPVVADAKP